jgi:hypothetical protein
MPKRKRPTLNAGQQRVVAALTRDHKRVERLQLLGAGGTGKGVVIDAVVDEFIKLRGGVPCRAWCLSFKALVAQQMRREGLVAVTMHSFLGLTENQRTIPATVTEVFKERAATNHHVLLGGDRPARLMERAWGLYVIDEHAVMDARLLKLFFASISWLHEKHGVRIRTILAAGDYTQAECFGQAPHGLFKRTKTSGWTPAVLIENKRFRPAGDGPEHDEAARNLETVCSYLRDTRAIDDKGTLPPEAQRREDKVYRILKEMFDRPAAQVRPRRVLATGWNTARKHNDKRVKTMYGAARFVAEPHVEPKDEREGKDDDPAINPMLAPDIEAIITKNGKYPTLDDPKKLVQVFNGTKVVIGEWPQCGLREPPHVGANKVRGLSHPKSGEVPFVPVNLDGVDLMITAQRTISRSGQAVWAMPLQPTFALTAAKVQGETITTPFLADLSQTPKRARNRLFYVMLSRATTFDHVALPATMTADDVIANHKEARFNPAKPKTQVQRAIAMQLRLEDKAREQIA